MSYATQAARGNSRRLAFFLAALAPLVAGCAPILVRSGQDWDRALLPKQSDDANEVLLLQSNQNCQFLVDSQALATGRRVYVRVTKKPHQIICKPDGYRAKEEYVHPPFDPSSAIGFTFLIEDQLSQPQAGGRAGAAPPAPKPRISSDVDNPKYSVKADPEKFALVVGIEKYSNIPDAEFAERDAQAVRDHLVALGYPERNVVLLKGDKATRTGLVKNLETWLPRNVGENSTVFFYYSGHGAPEPKSGQAYLVPYDGDPQYLSDTAYPVGRLYEKLAGLKAKHVLVALDSCFSGAGGRSVLAKGTRPLVNKVETGFAAAKNLVALTASEGDQISGTIEDQGHGLFTYFLLRGLNGEAASGGAVTMAGLYDYLSPKVQDNAHRNNRDQKPQFLKGGGDLDRLRLR